MTIFYQNNYLENTNKILLIDYIYKTNMFKILLFIIVKVTSLNITYYIIFAFLSAKMVDDYCQIFSTIKKLYEFLDIPDLKIIVTNINSNIIYAILEKFSIMSHL